MKHSIHVAVPSYNNAKGLKKLIPQLIQQDFASVMILDDGSTDETKQVVQNFPVTYICSAENRGTVAAKNLFLQSDISDGVLVFIDSDMEIVSKNIPEKIDAFFHSTPKLGAGVGKIIDNNGNRNRWNYGYDITPWRAVGSFIFSHLAKMKFSPHFIKKIASLFTPQFDVDKKSKIDWAVEAFFFIKVDLFRDHGGYYSGYKRFHEGPDLCLQLRKNGHQVWFLPEIVIKDTDQHTGSSWHRMYHWWRSVFIYYWRNPSRLLVYKFPRP